MHCLTRKFGEINTNHFKPAVDLNKVEKKVIKVALKKQIKEGDWQNLQEAALAGATSEKELALACNINLQTLRKFLKQNPEHADKLKVLSGQISYLAKQNLAKQIAQGSHEISKWWLERHPDSEFNVRSNNQTLDSPLLIILDHNKKPINQAQIEEAEVVNE